MDHRYGHVVNRDLASHHMAGHGDVPDMQVWRGARSPATPPSAPRAWAGSGWWESSPPSPMPPGTRRDDGCANSRSPSTISVTCTPSVRSEAEGHGEGHRVRRHRERGRRAGTRCRAPRDGIRTGLVEGGSRSPRPPSGMHPPTVITDESPAIVQFVRCGRRALTVLSSFPPSAWETPSRRRRCRSERGTQWSGTGLRPRTPYRADAAGQRTELDAGPTRPAHQRAVHRRALGGQHLPLRGLASNARADFADFMVRQLEDDTFTRCRAVIAD